MAKILITGGTGLVGKRLSQMLIDQNHDVLILSRNPKNKNEYKWDVANNYIDENALLETDYIIHLAGAGIADKRWSVKRKQVIIDSRVKTANLLFKKIKEYKINLKGFISASGIGYYGAITSKTIFKETDTAGSDFLGEVCQKWENAAHQFANLNIPVTILRTGIVLAKEGGALDKMKTPIISPLGTGIQYLAWIHIDDLCEMYIHSIENTKISNIYNAVAPEHLNNQSFTQKIATSLNKSIWLPKVPGVILKLILGDMSKIITEGSRVSSEKISQTGFKFKYPTLDLSLTDLVSKD